MTRAYDYDIAPQWLAERSRGFGRPAVAVLVLVVLHASALAGPDDPPADRVVPTPTPPAVLPLATPPGSLAGRDAYRALVRAEAARAGVPADVADAVTEVESSYNPATIGAAGEIGLMQVMPQTARLLGFSGTLDELAVPEVNIHYGVTYLAQAWRLAGGDICTAVMKYRAGHGETRFSYRSVDYCVKVRAKLFARGYPVVGDVPVATFGDPPGRGGGGRALLARSGGPNFTALNNSLRAVVTEATASALRIK